MTFQRLMLIAVLAVIAGVPWLAAAEETEGPDYGDAETLAEIIGGDDGEARMEAAERAEQAGAGALPLLAPLLADEDPAVSRLAGRAMERITHHAMRPEADEEERREVAAALTEALESHEDNAVRREVIYLLGLCGGQREAGVLARFLDDPDLRDHAVQALVRIPSRGAATALINALREADEERKRAFINALAQRGDPRAEDALQSYAAHSDEGVARAAVRALARLGKTPSAQEPNVRGGDYVTALLRAAYEMGEAGKPGEAESVYSLIASMQPRRYQMAAALRGLARVGSEQTVTHAMPHILDPGIARTVIDVLAGLDAPNVEERLASAYQVVNAPTQAALLSVLHRRESPAFEELAQEGRESDSAEVRFIAKTLLGETVDKDTALETAEAGSHLNRAAAWETYADHIRAMGQDGGGEALEQLAAAVHNQRLDPSARVNAVQLIGGLGGGEARAILEDLAGDESVDGAIRDKAEAILDEMEAEE